MKAIAVDSEAACLWFVDHSYDRAINQERSQGARDPQSKCCFKVLGWILAEINLKYIILATNL